MKFQLTLRAFAVGWGLMMFAALARADACTTLVPRLPGVSPAMCAAAGLVDFGGRSVNQRILWGRDVISDNAKLRMLVVGGIHGDEMSSSAVVFHWIPLALQPPADMPHAIHWRFLPVLNPDGLLARPSKRVNANGVDLNRNFATPNWERDAAAYWIKRTKRDPRRWPGPKPLSEPESRFLMAQIAEFKPHLIVSIHAPYGVLDFDGPYVPPNRLGRLYLDQVGIYPGSLGNYAGVQKGVPVVTIELGNAFRTPSQGEMRKMWTDLLRWTAERLSP